MPLIRTTVGPRNAHSDAATGLRFYQWQGVDYPSVTTIRRLAGLPFNLHAWALSKTIARAIEHYDELGEMLTRDRRPRERVLEKNRAKEAAKWLRSASTEERDRAASLGTAVHDAATSGHGLMDVSDEVRPRLLQYHGWLAGTGFDVVATEQQVFNLSRGYAGTFDLLGRFPDGRTALVDLKTGKGTYMEHALQLVAYCMAEFVGSDDTIDMVMTRTLKNVDTMALLHLTDSNWQWQEVEATSHVWDAFLGLLAFAKFAHEHADIQGLLVDSEEGVAFA